MRRRQYLNAVEKTTLAVLTGTLACILYSPIAMDVYARFYMLFTDNSDLIYTLSILTALALTVILFRIMFA